MIIFLKVLFKKHKKHLPRTLADKAIGEFLKYGFAIFISAWLFQGMRYMNWRESFIKIMLDIVITYLLIYIGFPIIVSFLVAHTLNFILNGQLFAMYTHMGATNVSAKTFLERTINIQKRASNTQFISAAIAYGSLSRGCYKKTSDIDIRIIPQAGGLNWWKTVLWALKERVIAFFQGYPLDMYVFNIDTVVKKMNISELPIILVERNNSLYHTYPERISFEEFIRVFFEKSIMKNNENS